MIDKAKIASQISDQVLHSSKHPEARFQSRSVEKRADGFGRRHVRCVVDLDGIGSP